VGDDCASGRTEDVIELLTQFRIELSLLGMRIGSRVVRTVPGRPPEVGIATIAVPIPPERQNRIVSLVAARNEAAKADAAVLSKLAVVAAT
jgi:hypothetical protein